MLTFKKYSSIENSFDGAFMEKVRNHTPAGTREDPQRAAVKAGY